MNGSGDEMDVVDVTQEPVRNEHAAPEPQVSVRARRAEEEAPREIVFDVRDVAVYYGSFRAIREVTLPILWPGIWSGALFAFLLSWGNFPLSLYTTGPYTSVPEWLYAKMVAGYTPMVPALGTMSTIAAAAVLLLLGSTLRLVRRREAE